jgi:hypothetical protein
VQVCPLPPKEFQMLRGPSPSAKDVITNASNLLPLLNTYMDDPFEKISTADTI